MFPFTSTILPLFRLSTPLSSNLSFYGDMISAGGWEDTLPTLKEGPSCWAECCLKPWGE